MQEPVRNPLPQINLRSGIVFGPGRSTRLPEKGTPEYERVISQMLNNSNQTR
jgi:hypothetical protein